MTVTTLTRPAAANLPPVPRAGTGSPRVVSVAALTLLDRSASGLIEACNAQTASERYVEAHLSALRSAAAVLAVRGKPGRGGPCSVWQLLPKAAPELTEWAGFFAATAVRRAGIESGRLDEVSAREADDLLRDAESFQHAVQAVLGLPQHPVLPDAIPTCR